MQTDDDLCKAAHAKPDVTCFLARGHDGAHCGEMGGGYIYCWSDHDLTAGERGRAGAMSDAKPQPWFDGDDPLPYCGNQCPHYQVPRVHDGGRCGLTGELKWITDGGLCVPWIRDGLTELVQLRAKGAGQ